MTLPISPGSHSDIYAAQCFGRSSGFGEAPALALACGADTRDS